MFPFIDYLGSRLFGKLKLQLQLNVYYCRELLSYVCCFMHSFTFVVLRKCVCSLSAAVTLEWLNGHKHKRSLWRALSRRRREFPRPPCRCDSCLIWAGLYYRVTVRTAQHIRHRKTIYEGLYGKYVVPSVAAYYLNLSCGSFQLQLLSFFGEINSIHSKNLRSKYYMQEPGKTDDIRHVGATANLFTSFAP